RERKAAPPLGVERFDVLEQELTRVAKTVALHARDMVILFPALLLEREGMLAAHLAHTVHESEEGVFRVAIDDGRPVVVVRREESTGSQDALDLRQRALGLHLMERLRAGHDVRSARRNSGRLGHAGVAA